MTKKTSKLKGTSYLTYCQKSIVKALLKLIVYNLIPLRLV
jgi:hypothetical protein